MDSQTAQFGPYTLLYPLGVGGMGEVFLARHQGEHDIHRLVAIKRMLGAVNRDDRLVTLFLDEVRIASQLAHGNIVQVIDHGRIGRQHFMAMEYVHGENFQDVLACARERDKRLAIDLLLHIACCVCQGLDYAHSKHGLDGTPLGIVHRDISPQNLLISFQGQVKIADFGIARAAQRTHETLGGELKGKLAYMSPEQANAQDLDHRSDLYSLGLVLYEALAGENPLRREKSLATLDAVRKPEIPPLADVRPDLPHELVEQVHWALSPDREDRPESARAYFEALQQTVRFYNLVVTPFDLADLMEELFPGGGGAEVREPEDATEVGRRADQALELLEQETVHYLRKRRGDTPIQLPPRGGAHSDGDTRSLRPPRRRNWFVLFLPVIAALTIGGVYFFSTTFRPTAPRPDAGSLHATAHSRAQPPPDLRRSPDAPSPDLGSPAPPPKPRPAPRPRPLPKAKKGGLARLTVRSTHPCRVLLNNRPLGDTPVVAHPEPAGQVRVTCLDTASGIRERRRVTLRAGEPARVEFRFGVVTINLDPWAAVSVDGKSRGTTPLRLVLREGVRKISLKNADKALSRSLSVEVNAGKTRRISTW